MKALKTTIEIPLSKDALNDMRKADVIIVKFRDELKAAGFGVFTVDASIVSRPGRG